MNAETENANQEAENDAPEAKAADKPEAKADDVNKDENSSCCGSCS